MPLLFFFLPAKQGRSSNDKDNSNELVLRYLSAYFYSKVWNPCPERIFDRVNDRNESERSEDE